MLTDDVASGNPVTVILIAKPPIPGEVKTRLAVDIGDTRAIRVYGQLLRTAESAVLACTGTRPIVYTYGDADHLNRLRHCGFEIDLDIGDYHLSDKVYDAFLRSFTESSHTLMIVADDAMMSASLLQYAVAEVVANDVVIGPTVDGGLYLIGLSRDQLPLVHELPFGSDQLCDTLLRRAIRANARIRLLDHHIDIDTADHLDYWRSNPL